MLQKVLYKNVLRQTFRFTSSDASKLVILKKNAETGFTTVTLNNPPVNSLGMNVMKDLIKTFDELVKTSIFHFLR